MSTPTKILLSYPDVLHGDTAERYWEQASGFVSFLRLENFQIYIIFLFQWKHTLNTCLFQQSACFDELVDDRWHGKQIVGSHDQSHHFGDSLLGGCGLIIIWWACSGPFLQAPKPEKRESCSKYCSDLTPRKAIYQNGQNHKWLPEVWVLWIWQLQHKIFLHRVARYMQILQQMATRLKNYTSQVWTQDAKGSCQNPCHCWKTQNQHLTLG